MPPADSHQSPDIMALATTKSNRFSIRFSLLLLGLVWFTTGASLATSLIATNEPAKFPKCDANKHPMVRPGAPAPASMPPTCDLPIEAPISCDREFSRYVSNSTSVVAQFDLAPSNCPLEGVAGVFLAPHLKLVQALPLLAMGVAGLFVVPFADNVGRKPITQIGNWLFLWSVGLCSFSPSIHAYMLTSAISFVSLLMMLVPVSVSAAELIPPGSRHYLALTQVIGFALGGSVVATLSSYVIHSWRLLTLLNSFPILIFLMISLFSRLLVESPKWLTSRGRMEDAYDVWIQILRYNLGLKSDQSSHVEELSFEDFVRSELESNRATIINNREELDEELSIMSVQYLASPDSVVKAFSNFPTSIWLACLAIAWIASGTVYSGLWHTRYSPLVDELLKALPSNQPVEPLALQPRPARLLQAAAPSADAGAQNPFQHLQHVPPPVQQVVSGQLLAPFADPARANIFKAPEQVLQQAAANPAPTVPLAAIVQPPMAPAAVPSLAPSNDQTTQETVIPNPRAYLDFINHYIQDGGNYLMDQARMIPMKAQEMYDAYEMDKMLADMRNDLLFIQDESLETANAISNFHNKSRVLLVFTTMTYSLDLPCALLLIFLSGRSWCGRKGAVLSYSFSSGITILGASLLSLTQAQKTVLPISMAVAGRSMLSAVYQMLFVYTSECVSTSVRCGCIGILFGLSCLTAGFVLPLSELIDTQLKEGTMLVIGATAVLASVVGSSVLPDTLGLPLCDTLEIQDVMYENLGYHDAFFKRKLHRIFAFMYQKMCCFNQCFTSKSSRSGSSNSLEAKGRSWLKSKINNRGRRHLFKLMNTSKNGGHDENLSNVDTNC